MMSPCSAWKARMATEAAKELYRARPGLCEWTNAQFAAHFGLRQFLVRGVEKARSRWQEKHNA